MEVQVSLILCKKMENKELLQLEQRIERLEQKYAIHQHNDVDGTNHLRKNIILDRDQYIAVGSSQIITSGPTSQGTADEVYSFSVSNGPDPVTQGFVYKSDNIQMDFIHLPNTPGTSRMRMYAKPLVVATIGTTVSTTAAGNTVTIVGYNFVTNELAGAFIVIVNSVTQAVIETQTIASNTATVITISGTWLNSTASGKFLIYRPVGLGDQTVNFRILYLGEGTSAGVRLGVGATGNGQNGLLYMDATGDLYWRDKGGVATKLN